jgi:hypothetical protein
LKPIPGSTKEINVKRKFIPLGLVVALLVTQLPTAFAQQGSISEWSSVQRIQTNAQLIVKQKNGQELKGSMIEATDSALSIDRGGRPTSIARTDVKQIYVSEGKAEKSKWAAIGAGIGAGAGAGIGAIKYSPESDDSGIYIVGGLLIGVGAGAVGGLLFGASRRQRTLVYSSL